MATPSNIKHSSKPTIKSKKSSKSHKSIYSQQKSITSTKGPKSLKSIDTNKSPIPAKSVERSQPPWKMKAPFKVATKRFLGIGFHPELDPEGHFVVRLLGPGQYHPERADNAFKYKRPTDLDDWKRKQLSEEFSMNMGFKHPDFLNRRRFDRASRGPGTHDVNEEFSCQCASTARDQGFGVERRFKTRQSATPGPGLYGKYHIPHTRIFESRLARCTKTPTMEFWGKGSRFKGGSKSWSLAPNRYDPKDDKDMNSVINRRVSLRGPYDLFTGPRDGTTIHNHFAPSRFAGPKTDFYEHIGEVEHFLNHSSKKTHGRFLKEKRFPRKPTLRLMLTDLSLTYRNPRDPGPAYYDNNSLYCIKKLPEQKFAFGENKGVIWPPLPWSIFPGPGRYHPKDIECSYKKHKRPSWVFKSVTKRREYTYQDYGYFF